MSESHNCGKHEKREVGHWVGGKWCDGRKSG